MMPPEKTAGKTARGRPFERGHDARRGGGRKGRSGRKPNAFKAFCRGILEDESTQAAIRRAAQDPTTRGFPALLALLARYGYGEPPTDVRISLAERLAGVSDEELAALEQASDEELAALAEEHG
jgi:hypothetical protein